MLTDQFYWSSLTFLDRCRYRSSKMQTGFIYKFNSMLKEDWNLLYVFTCTEVSLGWFRFFFTSRIFRCLTKVSRKQTLHINALVSGARSIGLYYFDRMEKQSILTKKLHDNSIPVIRKSRMILIIVKFTHSSSKCQSTGWTIIAILHYIHTSLDESILWYK